MKIDLWKNFFACTKCVIQHNMYHVHSVSFLFSCNILCRSQFLRRLKFSTSAKLFKTGNIQFTCRDNKVCRFFFRRVKLFHYFRRGSGGGWKTNYIRSTQVSEKLVKEIIIDLVLAMHGVKIFSNFRFCSLSIIDTGPKIHTLHCFVQDEVRWWTMTNDDVLDTTEMCHRALVNFSKTNRAKRIYIKRLLILVDAVHSNVNVNVNARYSHFVFNIHGPWNTIAFCDWKLICTEFMGIVFINESLMILTVYCMRPKSPVPQLFLPRNWYHIGDCLDFRIVRYSLTVIFSIYKDINEQIRSPPSMFQN